MRSLEVYADQGNIAAEYWGGKDPGPNGYSSISLK